MIVRRALLAVAAGSSLVLIAPSPPAGATVVATGGAGSVTVTMTGGGEVDFSCASNKVQVNSVNVAPVVACSALTTVTVTGDTGAQRVQGETLDAAAFSAHPHLVAAMGGGADVLYETAAADTVDLGAGNDGLVFRPGGVADTSMDLGADTDIAYVYGTDAGETISASSSSTTATITVTGGSTATHVAKNAERLDVYAEDGNDTINTTGMTVNSSVKNVQLLGQEGNDTITTGVLLGSDNGLYGGPGTNTFNAGTGPSHIWSESETDVITSASDTSSDTVHDATSLHSGSRTVSGFGPKYDAYKTDANAADTVVRVRPGSGTDAQQVLSLHRNGIQQVPAGLVSLQYLLSRSTAPKHLALLDAVAGNHVVDATVLPVDNGILDVTVPSGGWTVVTDAPTAYVRIDPTLDTTYLPVSMTGVDTYKVHGPWTNRNQGFAHRVVRDLLFRFPTDADRDSVRDQLAAGTLTRQAYVDSLMDTDEYRGLDVDRTFQNYLKRAADPSGRAYWTSAIRAGRPLWRFRAQLFGSSEYFTRAGGTNAAFVQQAYADVLGRAPDPSGLAYWTRRLDEGGDRGSVALQFLSSTESRRNITKDQFLRFLDRYPTTDEATYWVDRLGSSDQGEQLLIAGLARSTSYYNRS